MLWILKLSALLALSQGLSCPKYECKPSNMIFSKDTCLYSQGSTNYLSSCSAKEYCPLVTTKNSTCTTSPEPSDNPLYPGETCSKDLDCLSDDCLNQVCVGKPENSTCEESSECDVGLYCSRDFICEAQKDELDYCHKDTDCKNNMGCYKWDYEKHGQCIKYYSLPRKEFVFDCEDNFSLFCESGNCGGPGGKGVCIESIKPRYLLYACESDEDCVGESFGWQFYGECECGLNPTGTAYCKPFLGDYIGLQYLKMIKAWYESSELQKCHTMIRSSVQCLSNWQSYGKYLKALYWWRNYPYLQMNDECVKDMFTYYYWDLD